jgi:hypothetical protein
MNPQGRKTEANKASGQAQYADRVLERILAYVSQRYFKIVYKHIWTVDCLIAAPKLSPPATTLQEKRAKSLILP